ncbi:SH3 domain-containing protein [Anaerosacchariphilus polymeriproducens]|uniref:SH3b domain-containing protein n=1 Tax=Anaerosacchariphilus polymeriproducens TaxID=1812858 RepID=A0A371ARD9_9FIRM|nr:SH3 domain-containing protein [Anaerosacchariphilus polymeriproducens]RDU22128.1 hypothetical protein DWV06_16495 [Anaerosacchariphilus polymeriproducens]
MEKKYARGKSLLGVNKMWLILFLLVLSLCMPAYQVRAASRGKVTASVLNLRRSYSTSSSIIGKLPKGTNVSISSSKKDRRGMLWYKITATVKGKRKTGYVAASYIKKTTTSKTVTKKSSTTKAKYVKRYAKVKGSYVYVRKSTTTRSKAVGLLPRNTTVKVIDKKYSGKTRWYRIYVKRNGKKIKGYMHYAYLSFYSVKARTTKYQLGQAKVRMYMYKSANNYDTKLATISAYDQLIIRGSLKVYKTYWTKVNAYVNGKIITGYVPSSRVTQLISTASTSYPLKTGYTKANTIGRRIASGISTQRGYLKQGTALTIMGSVTVRGIKWYRCQYSVSGKTLTGYILSWHVSITDDTGFDASIAGFPSSYKPLLKNLHQSYPNWRFVPINTGLSWDTVIYNETKVGVNTISSTAPSNGISGTYSAPFSYLSTASNAYSWATDTYKLCDGTTWYTAAENVVKYYMDPRNALTATKIFQFESLAYNSAQSKSVVSTILKDTFMNGTFSYVEGGRHYSKYYNTTFMEAGQQAGVSPYFLAARARQELGLTGSGSVSGTYPGYEGYYNYFNIAANDSPGGGAIANGLAYAKSGTTYDRPWNTPYKSIVGGAKYIGASYIQKKQNTLYFQKFSVVNSPYYYWHQYMTNVQAPTSESSTTYKAYSNYGILNDTIVFYIPVYNNMPASPSPLPVKAGNPNSYLKSLVVKNGSQSLSFNKTFAYNETSYNMVVPSGVNTINISASAVSKYAQSVSGTGTKDITSLTAGHSRKFYIVCTAGNGSSRTYTITVTRMAN